MNSASQDTAPQPERVNGESAATRGLFDGPYQPPAPIDLIPTRGVLKPRRRARCRGKIEMTPGAQSRDDTPAGGGHGERGGTTTGGATA
jgi:hypothetical protein